MCSYFSSNDDFHPIIYLRIVSTLCSSETTKYELSPQHPLGYTETQPNLPDPTNGTLFYECRASSAEFLICSRMSVIADCKNYGHIFPLDTNSVTSCSEMCVLILWSHDQDTNITMVPEPSHGLNSTTCFNPCLILPTKLTPTPTESTPTPTDFQNSSSKDSTPLQTTTLKSPQVSIKQDAGSDDHTSLIIAVTISGGVALILLIVVVVFVCVKRKYPDQEQPLNESTASTDDNNDNLSKNMDIHFTQDDVTCNKDINDDEFHRQNVYHVNVSADVTQGHDDVSETISSSPVMTSMYGMDEISTADEVLDDGSDQVRL